MALTRVVLLGICEAERGSLLLTVLPMLVPNKGVLDEELVALPVEEPSNDDKCNADGFRLVLLVLL